MCYWICCAKLFVFSPNSCYAYVVGLLVKNIQTAENMRLLAVLAQKLKTQALHQQTAGYLEIISHIWYYGCVNMKMCVCDMSFSRGPFTKSSSQLSVDDK